MKGLLVLVLCISLILINPVFAIETTGAELSGYNGLTVDSADEISSEGTNNGVGEDSENEVEEGSGPVKRNPMLAGGLSFAIPGMGQFYNRELGKGVLHLVLYGGAMWGGFSCLNWKLEGTSIPGNLAVASFSVAFAMMLISMVYAYSDAKEFNVNNGISFIKSQGDVYLAETEDRNDLLIGFTFSL